METHKSSFILPPQLGLIVRVLLLLDDAPPFVLDGSLFNHPTLPLIGQDDKVMARLQAFVKLSHTIYRLRDAYSVAKTRRYPLQLARLLLYTQSSNCHFIPTRRAA